MLNALYNTFRYINLYNDMRFYSKLCYNTSQPKDYYIKATNILIDNNNCIHPLYKELLKATISCKR